MSAPSPAPSTTNNKDEEDVSRLLPEDYTPGENTVIIGRGKKIKTRKGNLAMFDIVRQELSTYSVAGCKAKKSKILVRIVERVKDTCPDHIGFVKQDSTTGRWYEVSMLAARTTVAQAFRDTNHLHYRSSKQSKQRRRKEKKEVAPNASEEQPISLRNAYHEHITMRRAQAVSYHPGTYLQNQLPSFRPMMHDGYGCVSPPAARPHPMGCSSQESRRRLVNILDTAVNCSEFAMGGEDLPASWTADGSCHSVSEEEEDSFEPVPISEVFEESSSSFGLEEEEEDEEDVMDVFDQLSVADLRAALMA